MADSGTGLYGLQAELHASQSSEMAQRIGNATMSIPSLLREVDTITVILFTVTVVVFMIPVFILFPPIPVERSDALRQTHTRIGLPPHRSNLGNQLAPIHGAQHNQPPKVQGLYIYPIKSCGGIELSRSRILPTGLEYDRLYTLAQLKSPSLTEATNAADAPPTWEFLTQRQLPLMANVKVDLWVPDCSKNSRLLGKVEDAFLVVRFPWMDSGLRGALQWVAAKMSRGVHARPEKEFMLPVGFPSQGEIKARGYTYADVKIWKDVTTALNLEKEVPPELAQYLGVKNRLALFRMDPSERREVFRCAPRKEDVGFQPVVDFHDAYPLHLLSLSSMQALDSNVVKDDTMKQLDVRRFRANIIISGSNEYEEEEWKSIRLENPSTKEQCHFAVSCRTVRCKLPNVDPDTGLRHKAEPDRALRKYRDVDEGAPKMGCLGMQMCPEFPDAGDVDELDSYVEVGMTIDVLQKGHHVYIKQ